MCPQSQGGEQDLAVFLRDASLDLVSVYLSLKHNCYTHIGLRGSHCKHWVPLGHSLMLGDNPDSFCRVLKANNSKISELQSLSLGVVKMLALDLVKIP